MNDADRKAFEDWANKEFYADLADIAETWDGNQYVDFAHHMAWCAWQAACDWRDSQVGEPVAWQFFDPQSNQWFLGSNMPHHKDDTIKAGYEVRDLFTTTPAAKGQA